MSDLTIFEAPDPLFWVGQGYAVVTIDFPGVWHAQSPAIYLSPEEAEAFADAVEWAGVSYMAAGLAPHAGHAALDGISAGAPRLAV